MLSMAPKKAVPKALNRQELSSAMILRIMVAPWFGRGSSGASSSETVGLRVKERGLLGC